MILRRFTCFKSIGCASFFSLPLYVGLRPFHGTKTCACPLRIGSALVSKSYSYEMVACSRPLSGLRGNNSSLRMNVYRLPRYHCHQLSPSPPLETAHAAPASCG